MVVDIVVDIVAAQDITVVDTDTEGMAQAGDTAVPLTTARAMVATTAAVSWATLSKALPLV
jgi:hypothetical protein